MKDAHLIECGWTNLTVMVKLKLTGKGNGFFFSLKLKFKCYISRFENLITITCKWSWNLDLNVCKFHFSGSD